MGNSFVHIASDISLYPLDNEAVLFSQLRQELYTLNTTATFIWLCLEDNLMFEEIVSEYAEAFDVSDPQAAEFISASVLQWQYMGYLWGVDYPDSEKISFNTALGRLVTNSVLREAFSKDSNEIAKKLKIRDSDYVSFVTLNPIEVDVHARLLINKKLNRRFATQKNFAARRYYSYCNDTVLSLGINEIEQHYQLLSIRFGLFFSSLEHANLVQSALAHLQVELEQNIDVRLEVVPSDDKILLLENSSPVRDCCSITGIVPMVNAAIRQSITNHHPHFLHIHAGVVAGKEACLLFPASAGAGKTTLVAGLCKNGYQYYSDEIALIETKELCVQPVPLSLTIKIGSVPVLSSYYKNVVDLPVHTREDNIEVRYLKPPGESLPNKKDGLMAVSAIIFPKYKTGVITKLTPIAKSTALYLLLEQCMDVPNLLTKQQVSDFIAWIERVNCYTLTFNDLNEAIKKIKEIDC